MVEQTTLAADLESIVGPGGLAGRDDPGKYSVDGASPEAVVSPANVSEVAAIIRFANERGLAIVPWGGGTSMHTGNLPAGIDIALLTTRLSVLVEHEPADMTATCEAGMTLGALQDKLAKGGQTAPFDPHLPRQATIGGLLATNTAGPARHSYGAPRDFTIGLRVVTGDALIIRAGGKVVKNVAGYDMCKLYVGSRGTLGVITEATFKLTPLPASTDGITFRTGSAASATRLVADIHRRGLSLRSAVLLNAPLAASVDEEPDGFLIAMEFAGTVAGVERSISEARALGEDSNLGLIHAPKTSTACETFFGHDEEKMTVQCSILPSRVPELIEAVEDAVQGVAIVAAPLTGAVRATWGGSDDTLATVMSDAARLGACIVVEGCSQGAKAEIDVYGDPPPSLPLMRRIKEQFDPRGVLSPGRFVSRI
jgi:glycolate oxidase FAD binding subunit